MSLLQKMIRAYRLLSDVSQEFWLPPFGIVVMSGIRILADRLVMPFSVDTELQEFRYRRLLTDVPGGRRTYHFDNAPWMDLGNTSIQTVR